MSKIILLDLLCRNELDIPMRVNIRLMIGAERLGISPEKYLSLAVMAFNGDILKLPGEEIIDPWVDMISCKIENMNIVDKDYVWVSVGIKDINHRNRDDASRISMIMLALGYESKQIMVNGTRTYKWVKPQ